MSKIINKKSERCKVGFGLSRSSSDQLLKDIRFLIESARSRVAMTVNSGLVMLYWGIGARLQRDVLKAKRAEYGKQIFYALSRKLVVDYGAGFSRRNLFHMARFADVYPNPKIVHALSTQLSWTHLRQIIYLESALKRDFFTEMCRIERWSTRALEKKSTECSMNGPLFRVNQKNWPNKN